MTEREFCSRLRRAIAGCIDGADFVGADSWSRFVRELDSIQFIEIVVAIESEFGVAVPDTELSFQSFSDYGVLFDLIRRLLSGK